MAPKRPRSKQVRNPIPANSRRAEGDVISKGLNAMLEADGAYLAACMKENGMFPDGFMQQAMKSCIVRSRILTSIVAAAEWPSPHSHFYRGGRGVGAGPCGERRVMAVSW